MAYPTPTLTVVARRGSTPQLVRRMALALPETTEGEHFEHPDVRVRGRIFATLPPDGDWVNLKTTPVNLEALVAHDPAAFRKLWGGRWLGVRLDRVTRAMLQALLVEAWRLAAPKRVAATFDRAAG